MSSAMGLWTLRGPKLVFSHDPETNRVICEEEMPLVLGDDSHCIHNSVDGSYFPGYSMVTNMVER